MTWKTFASQSSELADFAQARLHGKIAYPKGHDRGSVRRHWKAGE